MRRGHASGGPPSNSTCAVGSAAIEVSMLVRALWPSRAATRLLNNNKSAVLHGVLRCRLSSQLQRINRHLRKAEKLKKIQKVEQVTLSDNIFERGYDPRAQKPRA